MFILKNIGRGLNVQSCTSRDVENKIGLAFAKRDLLDTVNECSEKGRRRRVRCGPMCWRCRFFVDEEQKCCS
jgi:hypothetical protein